MKRFPILSAMLQCSTCTTSAAIDNIPDSNSPEQFGQIQKLIFQRTMSDASTENTITIATTNPELHATWVALKGATDSTKVQISPLLAAPESEAGEAREYGGGNATPGGRVIILGAEPSTFTAEYLNIEQAIIAVLKKYADCEDEISIFPVNECGWIGAKGNTATSPTTVKGFPIHSFFVSDKQFGGYENPDKNMMRFQLPQNWSNNFYIIKPTDFNPLRVF